MHRVQRGGIEMFPDDAGVALPGRKGRGCWVTSCLGALKGSLKEKAGRPKELLGSRVVKIANRSMERLDNG